MGSFSDYLENATLDHVLGTAPLTSPTVYIGLSTADPTDDGSGMAEPAGGSYARVEMDSWAAAASRAIANNATVTFPQASGSWGTITHWALFDAATNGNMLAHGALSASKAVGAGNTPRFVSGEIEVSFSAGAWTDFLAHEILDHVFGGLAYSAPTIHVALSTTAPADDGSNITEPAGNGYARKAHASWNAAAAGATANNGAITFADATGSWGTITHAVIFDALTVGNALMYLDVPDNAVGDGDTVEFPSGDLDLTLS